MSTPFKTLLDLIQNGTPVDASTTNVPLLGLYQRTQALWEQLQNALYGVALLDREVAVSTDVQVGTAVYRDASGVYRPALASVDVDPDTGVGAASMKANVAGVCQEKLSPTLANVAVAGRIPLTAVQLAAASVDGAVFTGQVFLSGTPAKAGYLTKTRPPVGVPVGHITGPDGSGNYQLFVHPALKTFAEDHVHYHVQLYNYEALDSGDIGWLAADDAIFAGKAPGGAAYGYLLEQDDRVSNFWPPIPVDSVHVEHNGVGVETNGDNPLVVCDAYGLWWMDSCTTPFTSGQHGPASSSDGGCYAAENRIDLWFTRMVYKTGDASVTSLAALDDTLVITGPTGAPKTGGPLLIRGNYETLDTLDAGATAVKSVSGNHLQRGPVLTALKAASTNVKLTGLTHPTVSGAFYGPITIDFDHFAQEREGPIEFMAIDKATLERSGDVYYLNLPSGVTSTLIGRIRIPDANLSGAQLFKLGFLVLGTAGAFPNLTLTYLRIPESSAPAVLPSSFSSWSGGVPAAATSAGQTAYVETSAISVNPGDLVIYKITGSGAGIIDQHYRLDAAS